MRAATRSGWRTSARCSSRSGMPPTVSQIADIKYAPKALMNAVYVTGREEIAGTDVSSFCAVWASR